MPQRLLCSTFASARTFPAAGYDVPPVPLPAWLTELTPEQRSVCQARFMGAGGASHGLGKEITLPGAGMSACNPEEQWFWDLSGILVMRGVMDQDWLDAANATLDKYEHDTSRAWTATDVLAERGGGLPGKMDIADASDAIWAEGSSELLVGKPRPRLGGLYELPSPDCDPFRRSE